MKKEKVKKFCNDVVFPFTVAIVIAIVCLGFKYGDKIVGESEVIHVNNSTNLASLNLGNDGSTKTVYFDMTGSDFTETLNRFCEEYDDMEIVSVTREVSGNPIQTTGYKVVFK
jgi:hypothetical protein